MPTVPHIIKRTIKTQCCPTAKSSEAAWRAMRCDLTDRESRHPVINPPVLEVDRPLGAHREIRIVRDDHDRVPRLP